MEGSKVLARLTCPPERPEFAKSQTPHTCAHHALKCSLLLPPDFQKPQPRERRKKRNSEQEVKATHILWWFCKATLYAGPRAASTPRTGALPFHPPRCPPAPAPSWLA